MVFLIGIAIGFGMAVPIGPIGIIFIRKALTEGFKRALVVALGAATADFMYGAIAAFGLTVIEDLIQSQMIPIRIVGGLILLYLGYKTYKSHPELSQNTPKNGNTLTTYISTVFLTLTNPATIIGFLGIFATLGLGKGLAPITASQLSIGIFVGSFLWFMTLSYFVRLFRKKLNEEGLWWVNKISGVLITLCGLLVFLSVLKFIGIHISFLKWL
jgi:threonine/homoserine/homoserine lactone efflux protein